MGINKLEVFYHNRHVGTLADDKNKLVAFSYSDEWLDSGFPISPFTLPLEEKVFLPKNYNFDGLFGVFADSLPDAWGRLLIDRMLKRKGVSDISMLERLAIVGESGNGALCYRPNIELQSDIKNKTNMSVDELADACRLIVDENDESNLDEIYRRAGSSGGTRPKVNIEKDGKIWLLKFPSHDDIKEIGTMEYEYMKCAKECGIRTPEFTLFPSKKCKGYFASQRFDKEGNDRKHILTASAILETDYRVPSLSYEMLLKLIGILSVNNVAEIENMYRLMCFNIFSHNQDDHGKNFSFVYEEKKDLWTMTPAYDLTYSHTYYGEQTTTVNGKGKDIAKEDLLIIGRQAGINAKKAKIIIEEIDENIRVHLKEYLKR